MVPLTSNVEGRKASEEGSGGRCSPRMVKMSVGIGPVLSNFYLVVPAVRCRPEIGRRSAPRSANVPKTRKEWSEQLEPSRCGAPR